MRLVLVAGARPNFMKIAPLIRAIHKYNEGLTTNDSRLIDYLLVHTGQHYDYEMSQVFFKDLELPQPDIYLGVGSGTHAEQTGKVMIEFEKALFQEKPDLVVVVGDVNSTLAAALASVKLHIPVAHVEAGPRMFDKDIPEEVNRILTDHISSLQFAPTQTAVDNLKKEGVSEGVYLTGDVMLDSFLYFSKVAEGKSNILDELALNKGKYLLATVHRARNTDNEENPRSIIEAFLNIEEKIVFPVHPRTLKKLKEFDVFSQLQITNHPSLITSYPLLLIDPAGYLDSIALTRNAKKVLADSGGLQKEAYFARVPCVTLDEATGWPEMVERIGWNIIVGSDKGKIIEAVRHFEPKGKTRDVFGDGKTAENRGGYSMSQVSKHNRLRVLFLPAWYPSEIEPVGGIFVREHARAASLYNDIVVLYAYLDPSPQPKKLYRVSEDIEDGIRTIRVRYGGIILYLRNLLVKRRKETLSQGSPASNPVVFLSRVFAIPKIIIGDLLYYWSIIAAFRKLVKEGWKPDIIHAHVFTAGMPAVILGKLYHIPVVINERWSGFPLGKLTLFNRIKAKFAMSRAQIILPTSDYLRRHIEAYGIKNKFEVVPNVVNTEIFYPLPPQSGGSEGRKNQSKRLLLVAVLTPVKGVPYLLEALSEIRQGRKDFSLDIVGDGPNRQEYEELSRKLGLNGIVNFHGLKLKGEVAQFMRNCDFFVQPSLQETFGVVYIEAMACGKPVIATNAGGPNEILNEEAGILVPPKDVKALKEAIEYMLDNYANYSSGRIAQYARERFSYETVGKMLDEVYGSVLGME